MARIQMRLCRKLGSTLISVAMMNAEGMRSPKSIKGLMLTKLSGALPAGPFSHSFFDNVIIDSEVLNTEI